MTEVPSRDDRAREHVAATNRISLWMRKVGVDDPDVRATLAVGLADLTFAASTVERHLEQMLQEDVSEPAGADRALGHAAHISAWLFGELKDHLLELEAVWEAEVEERLAALGPPDSLEDDRPAVELNSRADG